MLSAPGLPPCMVSPPPPPPRPRRAPEPPLLPARNEPEGGDDGESRDRRTVCKEKLLTSGSGHTIHIFVDTLPHTGGAGPGGGRGQGT